MKKFFCVLFFLVSIFGFASDDNGLGIVDDADLRAAGVKSENIKKAKELMNQVASNYELRLLERKQLELQINKYILDGPEKYLKQIDEMFDKIGAIEAAIMKERLRSQIQMKKYITAEQYMKAKEIVILKDIYGYKLKEIAEIKNMNLSTVKSVYYKALKDMGGN